MDSGGRWDKVKAWLSSNGYNEDSFAGQIRAIYESEDKDHMSKDKWAELKELTNTEQATELFCIYYEGAKCIPQSSHTLSEWNAQSVYYNIGTWYQGLTRRKNKAEEALKVYHGSDWTYD